MLARRSLGHPAIAGERSMPEQSTHGDSLAILKRLVTDLGTPRVLRLIAEIAAQHADDLRRQGASPHAARCAREAQILSRACEALRD
jgi:hypothetical protein